MICAVKIFERDWLFLVANDFVQGSVRCLAFRRTVPAFEPSLYQGQLPPPGNAIFQGRDKDLETVPAIQSADCRDKIRAQIAAGSGRFARKPGNPRLLRTVWWAWEDSNFQQAIITR